MAAPMEENSQHGKRVFYTIPGERKHDLGHVRKLQEEEFMKYINESVIGNDVTFSGPFGSRKATYCDYTASGKALQFIEDYIRDQVLPAYGNTHTTTSVTSLQTTLFRHEARDIIRNAVNASEYDAVIFTGTGCTAAVHKLVNALKLTTPPVVFVGPYEHHSNLLPWREMGAEIVRIPEDANGLVDTQSLEEQLKAWKSSGPQLIGCFSAASNVTGILVDTVAITIILHRHKALAFWDYATAGPYVKIDMNPVVPGLLPSLTNKDAIFMSPHKFVGGVETPGILVAKKALFVNPTPTGGGGGSVFFVRRDSHRYLKQIEMREEGGTPSVVGAIRAGLVLQLKETVGPDMIMKREHAICRSALERLTSCPELVLLGSASQPRLPIFSFLVRHHGNGQFLHHNFICAVLNDVFGIQARGGCACAGPYAQDLLGIDEELAVKIENMLLEDSRLDRVHLRRYSEYSEKEILRPGFARLNIPFFMGEEEREFVVEAMIMVAKHGWKLLPQYMFNPETGEWKQRSHQVFEDRRWLGSISYASGHMTYPEPPVTKKKGPMPASHQHCLQLAEELFQKAEKMQVHLPDQTLLFDEESSSLRWFMLPSEAYRILRAGNRADPVPSSTLPFEPPSYPLGDEELGKRREHLKKSLASMETRMNSDSGDDCNRYRMEKNGSSGENEEKMGSMYPVSMEIDEDAGMKDALHDRTSRALQMKSSNAQMFVDSVNEGFSDQSLGSNISGVAVDESKMGTRHDECEQTTEKPSGIIGDTGMPTMDGSTLVEESLSKSHVRTAEADRNDPGSVQAGDAHHLVCDEDITNRTTTNILDVSVFSQRTSTHDAQGTNRTENGQFDSSMCDRSKPEVCLPCQKQQTVQSGNSGQNGPPVQLSGSSQTAGTCLPFQQQEVMQSSGEVRHDGNEAPPVKFKAPPKKIFKPTLQALEEYSMLQDGDRVLVCLSGGKDSLSLLHTLRQYQFAARKNGINFELGAVTIDPQTPSFNPRPLIGYLAKLGLPYFYEEQCIIEQAASLPDGCDSICSFCSRMKRGRLYACARREGYNVLAMGQHLDDLTESFLMSVFHNGLLRTMKANYTVKEGDLRVIRPFVYVREKDLRDFADQAKLPVIPENCPACFEAPKERHRVKQLLASQELLFPRLYPSLQTALKPLMAKNKTGMESSLYKSQQRDDEDF